MYVCTASTPGLGMRGHAKGLPRRAPYKKSRTCRVHMEKTFVKIKISNLFLLSKIFDPLK